MKSWKKPSLTGYTREISIDICAKNPSDAEMRQIEESLQNLQQCSIMHQMMEMAQMAKMAQIVGSKQKQDKNKRSCNSILNDLTCAMDDCETNENVLNTALSESLFNKDRFIEFVTKHCYILDDTMGLIIYQYLTAYVTTFRLDPSKCLSINSNNKVEFVAEIEYYFDDSCRKYTNLCTKYKTLHEMMYDAKNKAMSKLIINTANRINNNNNSDNNNDNNNNNNNNCGNKRRHKTRKNKKGKRNNNNNNDKHNKNCKFEYDVSRKDILHGMDELHCETPMDSDKYPFIWDNCDDYGISIGCVRNDTIYGNLIKFEIELFTYFSSLTNDDKKIMTEMMKYGLFEINENQFSKIVTNIGHVRNADVNDVFEDIHYVLLLHAILSYHNIPTKKKIKSVAFPCTLSIDLTWRQYLEQKIRIFLQNNDIQMMMSWS